MGILDQFATGDPVEPIANPNAPAPDSLLGRFVETPEEQLSAEPDPQQAFRQPEGLVEEAQAGLESGTDQLQATLFGVTRLLGRELGIETLEEIGEEGVERNQLEAALFAPTVAAFSDVEDMDSFFKWAAGGLGQAAPSLALAAGTGGTGAVISRAAAAASIRNTVKNRMLRQLNSRGITGANATLAVENALASQAGFRMLRDNIINRKGVALTGAQRVSQAARTGGKAGVFVGSAVPQIGEADISLTEAGIDAGFTSIVAGVAGGALETLAIGRFMDRAFPGVGRDLSKAFVRDFVKGTGLQLAIEGSTEAAQEAIQLAARAYHDPSFDMLSPDSIQQITDAFAAGALVGGVMGFAGEAGGGITTGLQNRAERRRAEADRRSRVKLPTFEMPVAEADDDFVPADNTFFEEVSGRINRTVKQNIEPAINIIRDKFQEGLNGVATTSENFLGTAKRIAGEAKAAHDEFIAGHQHIIDDTVRWAKEQAQFISEQAEGLTGQARQDFIAEKMQAVNAQVKEVADVLRERADQVVESLNGKIDRQGVFDEDATLVDQDVDTVQRDTDFTFGKSKTEGDQAIGFKDRTSARKKVRDLKKQFPSATDSTFAIRELDDGTFIVELADSGQAQALRDDKTVTDALDSAIESARRNPDRDRQAHVQRKGQKGKTFLDIRTLVFAGSRLEGGSDNQTAAQGFAAMAGRLLDRGVIDNEGFIELQSAFDRAFPGKERQQKLKNIKSRHDVTEQAKRTLEALTPQQRQNVREAIDGQLAKETFANPAERATRRNELLVAALENIDVQVEEGSVLADEDPEIQGESGVENLEFPRDEEVQPPQQTRGSTAKPKKGTTRKPSKRTPKGRQTKSKRKPKRTQEAAADKELRLLKERAQELTSKIGDPETDATENLLDQHELAGIERQITKLERGTPESAEAQLQKSVKALKAKAKKSSARKLNSKKKIVMHLPGFSATVKNATQELVDKVSNLLSDKVAVRVINQEAAEQMVAEEHEHASIAQEMLDFTSESGQFAVRYDHNGGPTYVFVGNLEGEGILGLIHELGHVLHYDTWNNLSNAEQDKLWNAFIEDVRSGKRQTGQFLTRPGDAPQNFAAAQENIFEFKEWMADQFVDWMNNRRQPKTAIEKFLESVAVKLDTLVQFIKSNPGRYGMLNTTYAELVDGIARGVRKDDPTGTSEFYDNEGAAGRPTHILIDGAGAIVPEGLARTEWNLVKARLESQYPQIAARAKLMTDWIHNAYHLAVAPSTSVMRSIGENVPAALKLVSIFNREAHGEAKKSKNYHQRLKLAKGRFLQQRYTKLVEGMTDAEKTNLLKRLRKLDGTEGEPQGAKEIAMRKLFDEMHDYMIEAGLPVGRINNYFPKTYSREALKNNEEAIIKHLIPIYKKQFAKFSQQERAEQALQGNTPREAARAHYNSLMSGEADAAAATRNIQLDKISMQSPSFRNMRSRTQGDPFFDQFLDDNLDGVMGNYITAATKRAEYNRLLGSKAPRGVIGGDVLTKNVWNPRGEIDNILKQAKREGATKEDLKKMKNYIDANLGMYGRDDISDRTRTVMASIVAYNNMRVLMFTVFASLPDLVGPAIRSGSMKGAFHSVVNNMAAIAKNEGDLHTMARTWGIVSDSANQHILTEYVDNHYMPPTLRKWNDAFFKWTGLNYYTDFTRKMALAVGIDYVKDQAARVGNQSLPRNERIKAKKALAELGLTVDSVNVWVDQGERVWGGLGYEQESANDEAIAEALIQFVDESIMSPNASQRPILASHPAAMLVFHLKGFIYAIHDVVLKRLAHNFNTAETPAQVLAAISPAILMLALTALGLELRELVTGDRRTDRMDGWEYTWTAVERSGLLGISQLGWDFEGAGARGQSPFVALAGPAVGQLGDLISKPASQTIPKAIPIVSQLPWARDALRDATPLGN